MRILIDGDGCPVVDIAVNTERKYGIEAVILCDTSHEIRREGAVTTVVSKGADSVDFRLVNLLLRGDIAVTQDYGLAAMCLSRGARVLNQDGMEYTADNIDALLLARHTARKIRASGGRLKGSAKRRPDQDESFRRELEALIMRGRPEEK